jgi:dipeptidyl aminopeptidase/acylaminoacyl peptidase
VRQGPEGPPTEVLARGASARSLLHEYGSRPYVVGPGDVVYVSVLDDQRLYRVAPGSGPRAITPPPPSPRAWRYADPVLTADAAAVICVRERHGGARVDNDLVLVASDGGAAPRTLHEGHDFYATPVVSPDGSRLAWVAWDHPAMPWDATILYEATLSDGALGAVRTVAGGPHESVQQPRYDADGSLLFLSDRTGWWNLYRDGARGATPLAPRADEFADPPWSSQPSYVPQRDGTIAVTWSRGPWYHVGVLTPDGDLNEIATPWSTMTSLDGEGDGTIVAVVASPTTAPAVAHLRLADGHARVVRAGGGGVNPAYLPVPELLDVTTRDGELTHALYYPPTHPEFTVNGPAPLLVTGHVGPTSHCVVALDGEIAFWTSRGIAVLRVDYRGSSGYGRAYRDRLRGQWGVLDVADCVDAARDLVRRGLADERSLLIRGKSAGGFTALSAATFYDDFAGATSYYGIADLSTLARDTHKFEAHYLDGLVGEWPARRDLYDARSPARHTDQVTTPLLLIQGTEDPVVPLSQVEAMTDALRARHVPFALLVLEGEVHGLRRAASIRRALESELSFYGQVAGFTPSGDGATITLEGR